MVGRGADQCWEARSSAALVVGEAKARVWEEYQKFHGEGLYFVLRTFCHTIGRLGKGKQGLAQAAFSWGELLIPTGYIVKS